jgi:hypothetical protein
VKCLMLVPRWVPGPVPAVGVACSAGFAMLGMRPRGKLKLQMTNRVTNNVKCLCGWPVP